MTRSDNLLAEISGKLTSILEELRTQTQMGKESRDANAIPVYQQPKVTDEMLVTAVAERDRLEEHLADIEKSMEKLPENIREGLTLVSTLALKQQLESANSFIEHLQHNLEKGEQS
jgi:Tfp pilus assembly protein PilF